MNRRAALSVLLVVACLLAATMVGGDLAIHLLSFGPAVLLAALLISGRFVGVDQLVRLATRARNRRRRGPARVVSHGVARVCVRGGRLIAQSLAERGPPAPALARG